MIFDIYDKMDILDFEKIHGLCLHVKERAKFLEKVSGYRYYVFFDNAEVKRDIALISFSGNGNTIDEAIKDYIEKISKEKLIINAMLEDRREIEVPILTYKGENNV